MRWLFGLLIGLPLVLILILLLLLGTAPGTRLLLGVVVPQVPGLSITGMEGSIGSPLSLTGLRYASPALAFEAQRAVLRWRPKALLRGKLRITELSLENVRLTPGSGAAPAEDPTGPEPLLLPELPVDLQIDRVQLVDFQLLDQTGTPTLQLSKATLAGRWTAQRLALELDDLALATPALQLSVAGAVALQPAAGAVANAALTSQLSYQLILNDTPWAPLSGALETSGPFDRLEVGHTLEAPYASTLTGVLRGLPAAPGFDLDLRVDGLDPAEVRSDWPVGELAAEISAEGMIDAWRVELSGRGTTLERWRGELNGRLSGSLSEAAIESLQAQTSFGQLAATGSLAWAQPLAAELALQLSGFNPVEFAPDWPGAVDAEVDLSGRWARPDDLTTLTLQLEPLRIGGVLRAVPLDGELALNIADGRLSIAEGASLSWGTNELRLSGALDQAGQGTLQLTPAINDLSLLPELGASGSLGGTIELSGSLEQPRSTGALRLDDLQLETLTLAGADLEWALGAERSTRQQLSLRLESLVAGAQAVDQARLSLDGQLDDHQVELSAEQAAGALALRWQGAVAALPRDPEWFRQLGRWWTTGGSYQWTMNELQLAPATGPAWVLASGGSGEAASARQRLTRTCLQPRPADSPPALVTAAGPAPGAAAEPPGALCIAGGRDAAGALDLAYELEALPLALLDPWLPSTQALEGRLEGQGELRLPDPLQPAFSGQAALRLDGLLLRLRGVDPQDPERWAQVLAASGGRLELVSDGQTAMLALELPVTVYDYLQAGDKGVSADGLPAQLQAQLSMDLGAAAWGQVGLSGSAAANVDSLGFISALSPEITDAGGVLRGDLEIGGNLTAPVLDGSLRWRDGSLSLLTPGLELSGIELALTPAETGRSFDLAGSLRSGPGSLNLEGTIDLGSAADGAAGDGSADGLSAALRLTGDRALLADTAEVRLLASPTLFVRYGQQRLTVRGAIVVPEASIALQQFPPSAVVSSRDAVVVREAEPEGVVEQALAVDAQLNLKLGDQVSFSGFGLETRMTGELAVRQRPDRPPTGRGEIELEDGQFRAYGQILAIERGVALWTNSPLAEPGIDLRAYRLPRPGIKVGVHARGPLSAPRTELFSEPALTESDQLSYLVLGRPLENNSSSEQSLLSQAALALGIRGGNFLTEQFGDKLGVDEIGIEAEAGAGTDQAAFVVGKYLSPSLYVSYGVGLLDAVSRIKLEYFLSRRWTLQTESSSISSGGDLIYHIERK